MPQAMKSVPVSPGRCAGSKKGADKAHVLDLIAAEVRPRPVRDWLLSLGKTSAAQVAGRLERAEYLFRPCRYGGGPDIRCRCT
jgi:hypothetical protein